MPSGRRGRRRVMPSGRQGWYKGVRTKTTQEGPGAAAVAEKAVAIEEAPALS